MGSKEGWQPSAFVSRRQGGGGERRPEDFMDEEDLGETGIAPRTVKATEHFEQRAAPRVAATDGPDC